MKIILKEYGFVSLKICWQYDFIIDLVPQGTLSENVLVV